MSFQIILYKNNAEPNRLDKTSYLDRYTQISGVLRNPTSIILPTIDIQFTFRQEYVVDSHSGWVIADGDKVVLATLEELLQCNYCYIEAFKRYYYITDIISIRQGLWSISMSVDVLMSYKDIIKQQRGIVARNEFDFDDMLVDDKVPSTIEFTPTLYMYSNFETKIDDKVHIWNMNDAKNIIICMGQLDIGGDVNYDYYYTPTITRMSQVYYFDSESDFTEYLDNILNPSFWENLGNRWQNSGEFVVSNYVVPLDLEKANDDLSTTTGEVVTNPMGLLSKGTIQIGNAAIEAMAYPVSGLNRIKMWAKINEDISFDNFTDTNPYSRYYLYLPFIGVVEISSERIERRNYRFVVYDVDVVTGDFIATLTGEEPAFLQPPLFSLDVWKGNMYITLPNGYSNKSELDRNALILASNATKGLIENIMTYGSTMRKASSMVTPKRKTISKKGKALMEEAKSDFSSNLFDTAYGTLLSAVTDFVPSGHCDGVPNSFLNNRLGTSPWLVKMQPNYYYPIDYNHLYGRPLMENRSLWELNGYTEISDIHLENFGNATSDELSEIENILLSGIIL